MKELLRDQEDDKDKDDKIIKKLSRDFQKDDYWQRLAVSPSRITSLPKSRETIE